MPAFLVIMEKIISFKDFSFQYTAQKQPTLKNINLDIYEGQKVLICGPSGSGKSTLSNCINGLIPFSYEGKINGSLVMDGIETKMLLYLNYQIMLGLFFKIQIANLLA